MTSYQAQQARNEVTDFASQAGSQVLNLYGISDRKAHER